MAVLRNRGASPPGANERKNFVSAKAGARRDRHGLIKRDYRGVCRILKGLSLVNFATGRALLIFQQLPLKHRLARQ